MTDGKRSVFHHLPEKCNKKEKQHNNCLCTVSLYVCTIRNSCCWSWSCLGTKITGLCWCLQYFYSGMWKIIKAAERTVAPEEQITQSVKKQVTHCVGQLWASVAEFFLTSRDSKFQNAEQIVPVWWVADLTWTKLFNVSSTCIGGTCVAQGAEILARHKVPKSGTFCVVVQLN